MSAKEKNEPQKRHYLPQSYLENFKIANGNKIPQINVIPKNKHHFGSYIATIKDTGCETNYHTIKLSDSEKIEKQNNF